MNEPLDEQYLTWLYSLVGSVKLRVRSRTYWSLLRQLYTKEFVWIIPNDDNRVEDGLELRREFLDEKGIRNPDPNWMALGCSVLEMMLGLSRRLAFEAEGQPRWWFWHMIEQLGLHHYNDSVNYDKEEVNDALDALIWRTYDPDGLGGLFPLRHPTQDQRHVEIWYQMNAYLMDH